MSWRRRSLLQSMLLSTHMESPVSVKDEGVMGGASEGVMRSASE